MANLMNRKFHNEGGYKMMKFELARKYLVGFLAAAVLLSSFALPLTMAPKTAEAAPIVNAVDPTWNVTVEPVSTPTNPTTGTGSTHTITIYTRWNGALTNPSTGTVFVAVAYGGTITASGLPTTGTGSGVFTTTLTYGAAPFLVPGTYTLYGYISSATSTAYDQAIGIGAPATKTWQDRVATTFTATPPTATNTLGQTHTITIEVKDQFGDGFDVNTESVHATVTGFNPKTLVPTKASTPSGTYTATYVAQTPTAGTALPLLDTITVTVNGITGTVILLKTWTYTATFTGGSISYLPAAGTTAFNVVGDAHTITVNFLDLQGQPISVPYDLWLKKTNSPTADLQHLAGTGTGTVFSYTSTTARTDGLTITGTVAGAPIATYTATKVWIVSQTDVTPDNAVNALGAAHNFVIHGVPGETVKFTFTSAGLFSMDDLLITGAAPAGAMLVAHGADVYTPTFPLRASNMDYATIALDGTGSATITVLAQAPGKFYMDTWFLANDAIGRLATPVDHPIKRSKAYAEMHVIEMTPPEINPITQVPTWDVHIVTAMVTGEFPVKPATQIPSILPPEGGIYIIKGGDELWAINVPIANVTVNWEVKWTDQTVNRVYVDGYDDPTAPTGAKYAPGIAPFWFTAYSTSDAAGTASLTYRLDWNGIGTPTVGTCTYYFPCIVDTITATAGYGDDHLNTQYGGATGTTTKEWRDHAFKLIKYNGHTPIGGNDYIPGAKFFLTRSSTYGPITAATTYFVPLANNSYIYNAPPLNHLVTTDTYGEAVWFHLPYGQYYLYEAYAPAPYPLLTTPIYTGYNFPITATAPYWCGPEPKITTFYYPNTIVPTGPSVYKLTWCGTKMTGVTFEVTNLDTDQMHSYLTGVNGLLSIRPTDFTLGFFDPTPGSETWYKVHEISNTVLDNWGVVAVPDFYFFISSTGTWDGNFYDQNDDPIWELTVLPWAFDLTPRHWVVDPKRQAYTLTDLTIAADPEVLQLPGETTSELTVTALDQYGEGREGFLIYLTTDFGTLSVPYVVTGPTGTATLEIFSDEAGVATVEASSGALTPVAVEVTWTGAESEFALPLKAGWNLVGVPLDTSVTIANLFGAGFINAYAWDPELPGPYSGEPGTYWNCSNTAPVLGLGFWVKMATTATITMTGGEILSPKIAALYEGWNIVSNPFDTEIAWSSVTLGGVPIGTTTAIGISYDGTAYHLVNFATDHMGVGVGYWLHLTADATILYTK
jgi:hypothetical protein